MNKNAFLDTATPLQVLLSSLGIGAGGYGGMRLIQELMSKDQENLRTPGGLAVSVPEKKKTIPEEQGVKLASEGQTVDGVSDNLLKALAVLGGVPAGALGANALYHNVREKQIQQDIDSEQKKRLQIMSQFKQASETPLVDAFCESLITKLAQDDRTDAIRGLASSNQHHLLPFGEEANAALIATGLATALFTGHTMMKAREGQKAKEEKNKYEDHVSLAPQTL